MSIIVDALIVALTLALLILSVRSYRWTNKSEKNDKENKRV